MGGISGRAPSWHAQQIGAQLAMRSGASLSSLALLVLSSRSTFGRQLADPNCEVAETEDGDLVLVTIRPVDEGEFFTVAPDDDSGDSASLGEAGGTWESDGESS